MKAKRIFLLSASAAMLLAWALAGCGGGAAPPSPNPVQRIGIAEFDRVISSPDFSGFVVVFASWCPPCREELPEIARFYRDSLPQGLQLIGMSLDDGDSQPVQRLINELKTPFPVYQVGLPAAKHYKIIGVPTLMLIEKGRILEKIPGRQSIAQMHSHAQRLSRPPS